MAASCLCDARGHRGADRCASLIEIGDVERDQLGPAKRASEAQQQQCAVTEESAMARDASARTGVLRVGAAPTVRRMPRSVARTCSELVGGSRSASRCAYLTAAQRRVIVVAWDPWASAHSLASPKKKPAILVWASPQGVAVNAVSSFRAVPKLPS
jgi:hypothetical protein